MYGGHRLTHKVLWINGAGGVKEDVQVSSKLGAISVLATHGDFG
jgi:hypothetical protein